MDPYKLSDTVAGFDFYNFFNWEAISDPTHGRVNYVDKDTSRKLNLTYACEDTFVLRADSTHVLDPKGPGRNSVRIISKKAYNKHVAIFDVRHMPQGCGTWPAIWEVKGPNWPTGGEIDIVEGVNDQTPNAATLHTTAGCTMPPSRLETGLPVSSDCNWEVNFNKGCSVTFPTLNSYGPPFNAAGGGWFGFERTATYFKVWFWSRHDPTVPFDVASGAPFADPSYWGVPTAFFPNTDCDFAKHFQDHNIVINLTLCGDWAGNAYSQSNCPSTCVDYVNKNPKAFKHAYFDFASIRIYQ
jgi:hypothetical protein